MREGLIWGTGKVFNDTISAIMYHERRGNFKIKSVTSNDPDNYYIYNYNRVSKDNINTDNYDFVIIMAEDEKFRNIKTEALKIGFKEEQLIMSRVIKHPLFDIEKYLDILKSKPTIFANMCFGGYLYHNMCLEFTSPLINMYFHDNDYIKFLKSPEYYLEQELKFHEWKYNNDLKIDFPVASCADILINFNHNNDFEVVKSDWERRKKRINRNNIIYMMHTNNPEIEEQFNNLPYKKKICFVPYETNKKYSLYVDVKDEKRTFARIINRIADGTFVYYNPFDLLLTGVAKKIV